MTAMEILVVILSVFLAIFLFIGIVLAALLIKVTRQIKRVTDSAERTVNDISGVVASVNKLATPAVLAKFIMKQVKKKRKSD